MVDRETDDGGRARSEGTGGGGEEKRWKGGRRAQDMSAGRECRERAAVLVVRDDLPARRVLSFLGVRSSSSRPCSPLSRPHSPLVPRSVAPRHALALPRSAFAPV